MAVLALKKCQLEIDNQQRKMALQLLSLGAVSKRFFGADKLRLAKMV